MSAIANDDLRTSRITYAVMMANFLVGLFTVPLAITILFVLIKDRAYFGSYFMIYKVSIKTFKPI